MLVIIGVALPIGELAGFEGTTIDVETAKGRRGFICPLDGLGIAVHRITPDLVSNANT